MLVTIVDDCFAFHVLHNKIRKTIEGGATVKQPGNVWVFEVGKDLTLHYEPPQYCVGIHALVHNLDGDLFAILVVGSHR